jgi:integrase
MTLSAVLRRMSVLAVPHGFRSTFRDWCAEQTDHPREVAEMALAHAIGNKVEAAYRRGDLFDKRKQLMQDWGDYVNKTEAP